MFQNLTNSKLIIKRLLLLFSIIVIVITSCKRSLPCFNDFITPVFVGFKWTDLDTIVVRQYKKGDAFQSLIDTVLIISDSNVLSNPSSNDTTAIPFNKVCCDYKYLKSDSDWEIYLPALNRVVKISNIISPQKYKECIFGGDLCPDCKNPIDSFLQDGQQVIPQISTLGGYNYFAYINR